MALAYKNLDEKTRNFMLEELELTKHDGKVYFSNYLSDAGRRDWLNLLRDACKSGSDVTLARELSQHARLLFQIEKRKPKGGYTIADVPRTANDTLAEGQFNRLYIRAICRCALEAGQKTVLVYRAAERAQERSESKALVGTDVDAEALLAKLRNALDFESGFPEPNTGLTVTFSKT